MITHPWLCAFLIAAGVCLGTTLDNTPSDIEAEQDVADDAAIASQLAQDTADCHQHYGPNAQIMLLDGMHLVCRPPQAEAGTTITTAQVQP
jgi:hypothetical protein